MLAYFADMSIYLYHLLFFFWYIKVYLLLNDLRSHQPFFREQELLFDFSTYRKHFYSLFIQFSRIDLLLKYVFSIILKWKAHDNLNGF